MTTKTATGRAIIISGPSGSGKSTVVRQLLATCSLPIELSVSATTRPPRQGEQNGVDYLFLSHEEFQHRQQAGDFLECKEVFHCGDWYGTLKETVTSGLRAGKWVLLEIDVEGAMTALESLPDAVTFFLHPGSLEELERRLRERNTEDDDVIARRLDVARKEMEFSHRYQYEIINTQVAQAVSDICEHLTHSANSPGFDSCEKN
tara:strand:+ start:275 stop:886 length:612 start_codon:yes stop_codon:yes gene_type:complete